MDNTVKNKLTEIIIHTETGSKRHYQLLDALEKCSAIYTSTPLKEEQKPSDIITEAFDKGLEGYYAEINQSEEQKPEADRDELSDFVNLCQIESELRGADKLTFYERVEKKKDLVKYYSITIRKSEESKPEELQDKSERKL